MDETITCPLCGKTHPAKARFCPTTGLEIPRAETTVGPRADLPVGPSAEATLGPKATIYGPADLVYCQNCGKAARPGLKFCPACGSPFRVPAQAAAAPTVEAEPVFAPPTVQAVLPPEPKRKFPAWGWVGVGLVLVFLCLGAAGAAAWIFREQIPLLAKVNRTPAAQQSAKTRTPAATSAANSAATASITAAPTGTRVFTRTPTPTRVYTATPAPTDTPTGTPTDTPQPTLAAAPVGVRKYPCIAYYNLTNSNLMYACLNGTTWDRQVVNPNRGSGFYPSLAFDYTGKAHIAYQNGSAGRLELADQQADGAWQVQSIESGDTGYNPALAIDLANRPAMSFYNRGSQEMRFAQWDGAEWKIETIDTIGTVRIDDRVDAYSSTVFDAHGDPWVAYFNYSRGQLILARRTNGAWSYEVVDRSGNAGWYCSLAITPDGAPLIGYHDRSAKVLKLASYVNAAWKIEVVDSSGETGMFASLALDQQGGAHISHFRDDKDMLKYATRLGGTFQSQVVDTTTGHGGFTSLALDQDDRPYIAYYDLRGKTLWIAVYNGSEWIKSQVDANGQTGKYPSLKFYTEYQP